MYTQACKPVYQMLFRCDEVGGIARTFIYWGSQTVYTIVGDHLELG